MAYIYQADIYCDACGKDMIERLKKDGIEDKYGDSDDFPQYCSDDEESDTPQHCGNHAYCLDPWIDSENEPHGHFMENNLTSDGVEYVKQLHLERPSAVTQGWVDYYESCGIDFDWPVTEPTDGDWVTTDYKLWTECGTNHSCSTDPDQWAEQLTNIMEREQWFPNCWFLGERGDWNLLTLENGGGYAAEQERKV